jgi:hypothetical protein
MAQDAIAEEVRQTRDGLLYCANPFDYLGALLHQLSQLFVSLSYDLVHAPIFAFRAREMAFILPLNHRKPPMGISSPVFGSLSH